jgi:hypothetical protein
MPSDKLRSSTFSVGTTAVLPAFEDFQRARVEFAQEVAKLALPDDPRAAQISTAPGGTYEVDGPEKVVSTLESSYNLLADMRPLLNDLSPAVRENALLAMGRLSNLSTKLQQQIAEEDTLGATISAIAAGGSPSLLKAALFALHAAVKPSAEVASFAVERNALPALCERLEDRDSTMKAAAVWCLGAIANHSADLASAVLDSGAVQLLMQALKEPSLPLRRVSLACLGCIVKHDQALADLVHKEGALTVAVGFLTHKDMLLRRQACRLLASAVQHSDKSVEWVPSAARPNVVETLRAAGGVGDGETGAFAATLVQQLCKHSKTVSTGFYELKVVPLLVAHIGGGSGSPAPAAAALGHICDASADAAAAAVATGAIHAIKRVLELMSPPPICAVMCTCLGAISFAGENLANAVAESGAMQLMAEATVLSGRKMGPKTTELARKGLAKAANKCADYQVLTWLIEALSFTGDNAQHEVLAALLKAMGRVLGNKGNLRLDFMQRGALTLCQQASKGSAQLKEALKTLNTTYPPQMVAATDPNYENALIAKIS